MLAISGLLVVGVAVSVYLLDPDLSGLRPSYGSGIDPSLGSQVVRDFLADQDAAAAALSTGDASLLADRLTGNALQDVLQQISGNSSGVTRPTVSFHPESLSVLRAVDPNDPSLIIQVQEDGIKTIVNSFQNAAPSEQTVSFHGTFWMRISNGRYAIADQIIENQPAAPPLVAGIALAALGVLAIGLVAALAFRRRPQPVLAPVAVHPTVQAIASAASLAPSSPPVDEAPFADTIIRTFGGLHITHDGKDWVQALMQRPVTGFVWQRLLVGAIRDPASHPTREELARQVSPALDRETQLKRIRNVIYHGLRELPPPLRDRVLIEAQVLGFKLQGCDVDAIDLIRMSAAVAGRTMLAPTEAERAQRVLDRSDGPFLPDWEKVEDLATDRHPTRTELIKEVRELLLSKRIELALVLADTYLAGGRDGLAIGVLEPVLRDRPNRKDLADRLAAAYRSAGREAEAEALAARFA